jgi:RNA polymerase sigma-70 factor (ECF subfamily)
MQTSPATMPRRDRTCRPSPLRPEEELLATYAETGSREAFEELVQRYEREVYSYLHYFLGDAQLAEDAFQATFLQLHLKCRQFERGRRLRPWLYAIANHQAVDLLRRNRRHKMVSLSTAAGEDTGKDERQPLGDLREMEDAGVVANLEVIEDRERTRRAVDQIPARLRQVLLLVVYRGLKHREAAKLLGISCGTVKNRMNEALRSLHEALIVAKRKGQEAG